MSTDLGALIQLGQDITSTKYYALAAGTILFYDYFLMLADEVEYAWSGEKSWMFWLFFGNRYFPMVWQFWWFSMSYAPPSQLDSKVCDRTAFYTVFMFVVCTLLAQVALTVRIYAVTMKSIPITIVLAVITVFQLIPGVWVTAISAREGAQPLPHIPLDGYQLCVPHEHNNLGIAYTGISLLYDSLVFSLIMFFATRWNTQGLKIKTITETIAEDGTWYFFMIFTAHVVFVFTLNLGRQTIKLLPAVGIMAYLPVMISRIMLSLRKAAHFQDKGWSLGELSTSAETDPNISFSHPSRGGTSEREGDIPLDVLPGS